MTSIPKERPDAPALDPDAAQLDFFVSQEEIDAARAEIAAKRTATPFDDAPHPAELSEDDKRRAAWRKTWEANKDTREQKLGAAGLELAELRLERDADRALIRQQKRTLGQQSEELAQLKEQLAQLTHSRDKITIHGRHHQGTVDVEITPKHILTIGVDCGCIKHKHPAAFQIAVTRLGTGFIRATERSDGKFTSGARSGPTSVHIYSTRTIDELPPPPELDALTIDETTP